MAEKRKLRMHPQLLMDVIKRQAGTLAKAVMEGAMNAVDAKATKLEIGLTADQLTLLDDGIGITDYQQIEDFWETFGTPHTAAEQKVFGKFRMGRGQLFAFGHNVWRTGTFRMVVDVDKRGDDWELEQKLPATTGCMIDISLYNKLLPSNIAEVGRDLRENLKYCPVKIIFNGEQITTDPATLKWPIVTDEAYIKLRDTGTLRIYNLGVKVAALDTCRFGVGGEVVSRKDLMVNFARNEVMEACPVWREIRKLVDKRSKDIVAKQPALTDGSRQMLIDSFLADDYDRDQLRSAKILADAVGRYWAPDNVQPYRYDRKLTIAPGGDRRADRLMQSRAAFVLRDTVLEQFRCADLEALKTLITTLNGVWSHFTIVPFDRLAESLTAQFDMIPESEYDVREQVVMEVLKRSQYRLLEYVYNNNDADEETDRKTRALYLGKSTCADGWTNGCDHVVINRDFVKQTGIGLKAWVAYGLLLIHELCHNESDQNVHVHGDEFLQSYHDWTSAALGPFVETCMTHFANVAKRVGLRLDREALRGQDTLAKVEQARVTVDKHLTKPVRKRR